jgi:hypothetical protein
MDFIVGNWGPILEWFLMEWFLMHQSGSARISSHPFWVSASSGEKRIL